MAENICQFFFLKISSDLSSFNNYIVILQSPISMSLKCDDRLGVALCTILCALTFVKSICPPYVQSYATVLHDSFHAK